MLEIGDRRMESGPPLLGEDDDGPETVRWDDPASSLAISRVYGRHGDHYRLRLGSELLVDVLDSGRIVTRSQPGLPQYTVDHFIADQVLPRVIAHTGTLVIHAGAVRIGSKAILLMGTSGRGKSTLTASLDQAGFRLMGDDAMVISEADGMACVRPVYPSLRLLPDSIEALMPNTVPAGPVAHYSSKQRIDLPVAQGAVEDLVPITAIIALAERSDDGCIALRRLGTAQACIALLESSFALDPSDVAEARHRLSLTSKLAAQVPAFQIRYPHDYSRLPDVRKAILEQVRQLP